MSWLLQSVSGLLYDANACYWGAKSTMTNVVKKRILSKLAPTSLPPAQLGSMPQRGHSSLLALTRSYGSGRLNLNANKAPVIYNSVSILAGILDSTPCENKLPPHILSEHLCRPLRARKAPRRRLARDEGHEPVQLTAGRPEHGQSLSSCIDRAVRSCWQHWWCLCSQILLGGRSEGLLLRQASFILPPALQGVLQHWEKWKRTPSACL